MFQTSRGSHLGPWKPRTLGELDLRKTVIALSDGDGQDCAQAVNDRQLGTCRRQTITVCAVWHGILRSWAGAINPTRALYSILFGGPKKLSAALGKDGF